MGKVLGSVSTCHESMTCLLELLIWLILHVSLCRVCSLKYVSSCMLQMLSMRVQRHLHCALSSKKIQCNMQSLTSEPLALCETHRLRCSITINIKTLISYCTISSLYKNRQQLNNLILAFSIFFPKTHICHSFHSWPSHFFLKRLSSFSFHRLHRCWEVMTLNIDCHHHDHHRHNHQTPFKSWSLLTFCILAATSTLTLCQWKKAGKKHPILSHNYLHFGFTSLSCIQLTTTSKAYKRRLGGWDCATTQDNKQVSIVYTLAPILQPSDMTNGMEKSYFKPTHTAPLAQHMHHYF